MIALSLTLTLAACGLLKDAHKGLPNESAPRAQLSIGYSLLYQEADGIPKLHWLLLFKDKSEGMGDVTHELMTYYQTLAETMRTLASHYPRMRIDVNPLSEIEGAERKAIGTDMAKDFAPLIGKNGIDFEREALLMFSDSLNEQRHLTGVMVELETDAGLKKFLETTRSQLDAHYKKVEALLNRRYFTH